MLKISLKEFIEKHDRGIQRFSEILPGFLVWSIILFPIWGSLVIPNIVAYFVLTFIVFWFYRSFQAALLGIRGYFRIKRWEETNWKENYEKIKNEVSLSWQDIKHVVIVVTVDEPLETLRCTLDHLAKQEIAKEQIITVLAFEERIKDNRDKAKILLNEYSGKFLNLWTTFHPPDLPGEIIGKAANETWAARWVKRKLIDEMGYTLKNLTLTSCDADARFNKKYFSALNYLFITNPHRYRRIWQGPIFWHNNIDRVPALVRIVGILGNVIHLSDVQDPGQLFFNYSTYSSSFQMIHEVGYWDVDIIPEDWHIFLKAFFNLNGEVEVEPIFLPISVDAPEAPTYFGSLKNRYEQCKRHAWGATDIPYAINEFFKHPEIPILTRTSRIYKLLETHLLWSTNWFFLSLGATLPTLINPLFEQTVLGHNLPRLAGIILTICLAALFVIIVIDAKLKPSTGKKTLSWRLPVHYLEWFLMPIATLLMSALPGLEAHTRLMLGKDLKYRVTEKV